MTHDPPTVCTDNVIDMFGFKTPKPVTFEEAFRDVAVSLPSTRAAEAEPANVKAPAADGASPWTAPSEVVTSSGRLTRTTNSCVAVLAGHEDWREVFYFNEFAQEIVLANVPPKPIPWKGPRRLEIDDYVRIIIWFERNFGTSFSKEMVEDAVRFVSRERTIHAVREYLDKLSWDGKKRVDGILETYFRVVPNGDEHKRLVSAVGRRWLISCVARAYSPGCQVDTVLILEGAQGIGKSRGLEALVGKDFFCDSALDFSNKDTYQKIQGVWVYELAELDVLLRSEASQTKAFLSSKRDRFRPPYARGLEDIPRSVVFCGTVNHLNYLKDQTGNRRFWTVRCADKIDREGISADRDQLWAEAVVLFKNGEQWHLTDQEDALMRVEQEMRVAEDAYEPRIRKWLDDCSPEVRIVYGDDIEGRRNGDRAFSMDEIFEGALRIPLDKQNPNVTRRIADVLDNLGYERRRPSVNGVRGYVYKKKA